MRWERKKKINFFWTCWIVHMMYLGRGVWQTVKNLYSFSKYLSQVQKQLRCGPFLQRIQSSGKPKTGKQIVTV